MSDCIIPVTDLLDQPDTFFLRSEKDRSPFS